MISKFSRSRIRFLIFSVFLCLFLSAEIQAQIPGLSPKQEETDQKEIPEDALGRRTPRGTVTGFINSMARLNYSRAARYLQFPTDGYDKDEKENLVRVLQSLLDTGGDILPYSLISNSPQGKVDDDLEANLERIGSISADGEYIEIFVIKTRDEKDHPIWLFSKETISAIESLSLDDSALVNRIIPQFLKDHIWSGVPAGQWIVAVLLLFLCYGLAWGIINLISLFLPKIWKGAGQDPASGIINAIKIPLMLYMAVWIFVAISQNIGMSIILRQKFSALNMIVGILALVILLWRLSDFLGKFSQEKMVMRGNPAGVSIVLFLQRAAKIAIVVFGIIAILGAIGIDVTTGLAALGIGGIALALGAQKTIENFVGSVTLIADRPVRVGDFCRVGQITGTVEKIGIRSTRIRTLDRTLVTIPNGAFSSDTIENFAHRDKFRFITTINFRYETSPDQLRYLLAELRKILYAHPRVFDEPARVRFVGFGPSSLDIEIFAFVNAVDWSEFLEVREDLLLRMMDVVEKSGSDFAFPSQTLYFAKDGGLSKERGEVAKNQVKSWQEKGEFPVPKFSEEQIKELNDTVEYPPKGSVMYNK